MDNERRFRKGDPVWLTFGTREVEGVVEEDRGSIGVGGRRLYRVSFHLDVEERVSLELPAARIHRAEDPADAA